MGTMGELERTKPWVEGRVLVHRGVGSMRGAIQGGAMERDGAGEGLAGKMNGES